MEVTVKNALVRVGGVLTALTLAATACGGAGGGSGASGGDGDKVVVGAALPLSGPGSYFGVQDRAGFEVALEQYPDLEDAIELHVEDSACAPLEATNAAQRLINEFQPDIMFGEECSSATLAIMPIIERAGVPLVNPGSSAIAITDPGNDWTFRIMPNEVMQGISIARNVYEELDARRAVILHENTDAGIGNAEVFTREFEKHGGEVLANIGFNRDVQDFTSIATRISQFEDVDVIPTYTLEGQGVNITEALAQAGVTVGGGGDAIQVGTIWLPLGFEEKVGDAATGYIRIMQFVPDDPRTIVQEFVKTYKEMNDGEEPSHISAHAYDLMLLLKDAIERGGSDPESIRKALQETEGLKGVTGTITFDETGQNIEKDTMHYVETQADGSLKLLDWKP